VTSHDRADVAWRIARLADGDRDLQLGLLDLGSLSRHEVLAAVAAEAGFDPDPRIDTGPTPIDPFRVLAAWEVAGDRLARAAAAGERVLLASGHPAGLTLLYQAIQAGVEAISVADVNDPALVVAMRRGRTEIVVVMDDNVLPEDYWPCFQAVAARFP